MARNPAMTCYTEANELSTNLQITCLNPTSVKLLLPCNLRLRLRTSVFCLNILYICTFNSETPQSTQNRIMLNICNFF